MNHNHENLCKLCQIIKCHQYNLKPHYGKIQSNLAKAHIKTHHVICNRYKTYIITFNLHKNLQFIKLEQKFKK